jgi:hypothetical protein
MAGPQFSRIEGAGIALMIMRTGSDRHWKAAAGI